MAQTLEVLLLSFSFFIVSAFHFITTVNGQQNKQFHFYENGIEHFLPISIHQIEHTHAPVTRLIVRVLFHTPLLSFRFAA